MSKPSEMQKDLDKLIGLSDNLCLASHYDDNSFHVDFKNFQNYKKAFLAKHDNPWVSVEDFKFGKWIDSFEEDVFSKIVIHPKYKKFPDSLRDDFKHTLSLLLEVAPRLKPQPPAKGGESE